MARDDSNEALHEPLLSSQNNSSSSNNMEADNCPEATTTSGSSIASKPEEHPSSAPPSMDSDCPEEERLLAAPNTNIGTSSDDALALESAALLSSSPSSSFDDNNNNNHNNNASSLWLDTPLGRSRQTPWAVKILLPLLIFACHGLFLYGQIEPMWRLSEHLDISVQATPHSTEAKSLVKALNLHAQDLQYMQHKDKNVKTFTYSYAIQELWRAHRMPGKFLPRLAAVLLFLFSGVWPHTKLILLLLTWWCSRRPGRRKRILNTLGVLGKWSLVDVLVVCVMVGVLNLQWTIDAPVVWDRIIHNLPLVVQLLKTQQLDAQGICSQALHYSCAHPSKAAHKVACQVCVTTVGNLLHRPDTYGKPILKGFQATGGGQVELSVAGLPGIYYFCGAVILSIGLSLVVDWYDHVARLEHEKNRRNTPNHTISNDNNNNNNNSEPLRSRLDTEEVSTTPEISGTLGGTTAAASPEQSRTALLRHDLTIPPGVDHRSSADRAFDERLLQAQLDKGRSCRMLVALATTICVVLAVTGTSLQRNVRGAMPHVMHEIVGIEWTRNYSFLELAQTTGKAGGWDWMLMGTFALFIVVGPLIRGIMSTAVTCRRAAGQHGRKTITAVDFIGAFCAWEVFGAALVMVDLLMPAITSTILTDPRCPSLAPEEHTCLEVEFIMLRTFAWVLGGGILLLAVAAQIKCRHALY